MDETITVPKEKIGANALEAIANGTTDGLKLAVNVGAMLLVFTAMIAMMNAILASRHRRLDRTERLDREPRPAAATRRSRCNTSWASLFAPLAWLMGIDHGSLTIAGQVIGEKTILNEFYAYGTLGQTDSGRAAARRRARR